MILKLFIKKDCPKYPAAKALIKHVENRIKTDILDMDTVEGLSEALYYDAIASSIIILDHDKNIVGRFIDDMPSVEELNKLAK
ncbi:TPA: hypothetical protein HA235_06855 [Candidatus Woesearchaeota archaeon]|nr:hypothetical protein [uncultured archaeon]MBS3172856.1 hypothetical protein [Candidatus Woesearchaeota archaeon]HIH32396.1 hypothetical protein [Candidatus Woesearchaeota archaeon]HIH54505.1 hypothetical protein [Candidatus Woesearchaeota archaeon]HIJ02273.1 hypothetical protein [Candidatus Woesearchaeota archaeon]